MKYGVTDDRMKGLGRSFIKGPRFFLKPSAQKNCCEKCVFGSGEHAKFCSVHNLTVDIADGLASPKSALRQSSH